MNIATVLFTLPDKRGDPTHFTAIWGRKAVALSKSLGYKTVVLSGNQTTHANVSSALIKYNPRVVIHYGHGCRTNLQGQDGCIITRNYNTNELMEMAQGSIEDRIKLLKILDFEKQPLGQLSCPGICNIDSDPCADRCKDDTNVGLLKDKIILTTACFSADQLGKCAISSGADGYKGFDDLFLFPTDGMESQNLFGDLELIFIRELLLGKTIDEAEAVMSEKEDILITKFKPIKYMSLSLLWNKIHRKTLGNLDATIYY
jgi:hypothetical protein